MCGIVGYTGAKAAGELLLGSLELLEHRVSFTVRSEMKDSRHPRRFSMLHAPVTS